MCNELAYHRKYNVLYLLNVVRCIKLGPHWARSPYTHSPVKGLSRVGSPPVPVRLSRYLFILMPILYCLSAEEIHLTHTTSEYVSLGFSAVGSSAVQRTTRTGGLYFCRYLHYLHPTSMACTFVLLSQSRHRMVFLHLDSGPLSIIDLPTWLQSACQHHSPSRHRTTVATNYVYLSCIA